VVHAALNGYGKQLQNLKSTKRRKTEIGSIVVLLTANVRADEQSHNASRRETIDLYRLIERKM